MVQIDPEKRRQAMKLVQTACEKFAEQYHPKSITSKLIQQFLSETQHIDLMEAERLIWFRGQFSNLGWDETSKVHRYLIDVYGACGTYGTWINEGLALMADETLNLEYRQHIAADVEKLIKEAGDGDEQWVAQFWGQFYVKHPSRNDSDPKWLREAEKWLERAVECRQADEEYDAHIFCRLADVYRQRGKSEDAARLYNLVLSWEQKGCCEETYLDTIKSRLAMCGGVDSP